MARDLYYDPITGGPVVDDEGNFLWVEDEQEMAQHMATELQTPRGLHNRDPLFGVPFKPGIIGQSSAAIAGSIVRQIIYARPDVLDVLSFSASLDPTTRRLSISFTAQTTSGLVSTTFEA